MHTLLRAVVAACIVGLTPVPAATSPGGVPASPPLTLEAGPEAGQPSVAVDPREGFVVTWQERAGAEASLWFAILDRDGRERRRGRIAAGRDWFVNGADFPSLTVLENGDWVTHYMQKTTGAPYAYDIRMVRSTDRGRTWSRPVSPHADGTPTQHGFVTLSPVGGDRVLIAWLDGRRGASQAGQNEDGPMTLRSAVIDRRGRLTEEAELDDSTCSCCQTDSVRFAGRTLVAYRDRSPDEVRDIGVVVRSNDGAWSKPRILHADNWRIEGCPVNGPALATNGDRFVAAWATLVEGGFEVRYTVRQWDQQVPAHALATGSGNIGRVDAAPAASGGFFVTWLAGRGPDAGVQLAHIDASGRMLSKQAVANVARLRTAGHPRIATWGETALLAWTESAADGRGSRLQLALLPLAGAR